MSTTALPSRQEESTGPAFPSVPALLREPATACPGETGQTEMRVESAAYQATSRKRIELPPPRVSLENQDYRFLVEKAWLGVVTDTEVTTEMGEPGFRARVMDLEGLKMDGEFALEELSTDDLPLVAVGAEFYWNIGYVEHRGRRTRESSIRFRRLPPWSQAQINKAFAEAAELKSLFSE